MMKDYNAVMLGAGQSLFDGNYDAALTGAESLLWSDVSVDREIGETLIRILEEERVVE